MTITAQGEPRWSVFTSTDWAQAQDFGSSVYFPHSIAPAGRDSAHVDFRMDVLELDGLTLGRTRYGAAIRMDCGYLDNYHLVIPLRGTVRNVSGEQSFLAAPRSGAIYNHSRTATVWRSPSSDHLALKLDRALLERELALMLGHSLRSPLVFDMPVDLNAPESHRWMGGLTVLRHGLSDRRVLASQSLLALELRNLVVLGLLVGQRHNFSAELNADRPAPLSRGIARRAVRALEDDPQHPWTIGELAAVAGSSVRSLQENFQRSLGLSPLRYLGQLRLDHVHRRLREADPGETTVAAVAQEWGFAHLGRFSSQYRARFGCYPSETLRDAAPLRGAARS